MNYTQKFISNADINCENCNKHLDEYDKFLPEYCCEKQQYFCKSCVSFNKMCNKYFFEKEIKINKQYCWSCCKIICDGCSTFKGSNWDSRRTCIECPRYTIKTPNIVYKHLDNILLRDLVNIIIKYIGCEHYSIIKDTSYYYNAMSKDKLFVINRGKFSSKYLRTNKTVKIKKPINLTQGNNKPLKFNKKSIKKSTKSYQKVDNTHRNMILDMFQTLEIDIENNCYSGFSEYLPFYKIRESATNAGNPPSNILYKPYELTGRIYHFYL